MTPQKIFPIRRDYNAWVADETLDSKLEAQYEWFFSNSGLSVV